MACAGVLFWPESRALPPSVSAELLDYTNRIGPRALLGITNWSAAAITLDGTCLVQYSSRTGSTRQVTSLDANKFRVTQLLPNEGFVQEVFVFPAGRGEWQFEYYAAYSSEWLETKRSAERWVQKHFPSTRFRLTAKEWHKFNTAWLPCPP
jgi:hypothetical protein